MDPTSNPHQSKLEREALRLEQEIRNCIAAEQLMNFEAGQVLVRWLGARINLLTQKVTNGTFKKDHTGYIEALAQLSENRYLLRKIQISADDSVKTRLQTGLNEIKEELKGED
jgi:hypothetical protein